MEERQHVRHHRVSLLWLVLVFARNADCYGEIGLGRPLKRQGNGSVSCHVGPVHGCHVYRHIAIARGRSSGFRVVDDSVLLARNR